MRLTTIRKGFGYYIEQNKSKYFFLLLALLVGVIGGILFSCSVDGEKCTALASGIKETLLNLESKSRLSIFLSFLKKNLRCIAIVIIGTLSVYLMPLLFLNLGVWGFSIGFTACFITLYFGLNGFFMSLSLIITQIVFMIPLVVLLSVTAIDFTLHNIRNQKHTKKVNRKKFMIFCLLIFILLELSTLIDVFFVPNIINAVSAFI